MGTLHVNWWAFVLRGCMAILFGILTFAVPGIALWTLVLMFGAFSIVEGALNLAAALSTGAREPGERPWWSLALQGVVGIVAGLLAFVVPGLTAVALLYLIAGWAVASGILAIVTAIRLREQLTGEWALALSGALSILLGVALALFPGTGALAVVLWIGAYAILAGVLLVLLGFRMRRLAAGSRGSTLGRGRGVATGGHSI